LCSKVRSARKREAPQALARLDEIHAKQPLDAILVTGDLTDAGRSAEWAEFFDAFAPHPQLAGLLIGLPGNHDVNVVDRANPARLDLPTSPKKCLRQVRTVSALAAIQGTRVRVLDRISGRLGGTLAQALSRIWLKWSPSQTEDPSLCRGA
jgi:Calcineurin-like phosphoesterase